MNKTVLIVIVAVVALLVIISIGSYNGLVSGQEKVEEYAANIDAQLQRRADLIPNLVSTVQSYTDHEEAVFTELANARAALAGAKTMSEKAEADAQLNTALGNLIAIAEAYPELKSSELYRGMMDELEGCENRISYARTEYNNAVKDYNAKIRRFPSVIFANMFGFDAADYFQATQGAAAVPSVSFK